MLLGQHNHFLSFNTEAFASEFWQGPEEMFPHYYMSSYVCNMYKSPYKHIELFLENRVNENAGWFLMIYFACFYSMLASDLARCIHGGM